jgi:HD-GYP domain-containing protein (c-di-GMP phosphodiesterase class II)
MILVEARELANADGGTLYIMSDDRRELGFAIVQTSSLKIMMGGTYEKIAWKPVPLYEPDGSPNHSHVCAHVAITGKTVNIADVYQHEGYDFQGTRSFDSKTGYRSRSMLVVPMKNRDDQVIGVLQLLNAIQGGEATAFSSTSLEVTESLASQAAIALTNKRLIKELRDLLDSFIRVMAIAIDEKSPYTGGHVRRVAELTMQIARKINEAKHGAFAGVRFTSDEFRELETAAWLHDVGKITTPEYVVDKETKLQTIIDRIEIIKLRFELFKTKYRMEKLESLLEMQDNNSRKKDDHFQDIEEMEKTLREELIFLQEVNKGGEWTSDEKIDRIRDIGRQSIAIDGAVQPLITADELENLSIRKGTLTAKERGIIENHAAMTYRILSQLPFPEKMKKVADYASSHHEKLNGKGYPHGRTAPDIPIQTRIIAMADIFEALTASDRPYRKGNTIADAMRILELMAKDRDIDPDVYELFLNERLHEEYAIREMAADKR